MTEVEHGLECRVEHSDGPGRYGQVVREDMEENDQGV